MRSAVAFALLACLGACMFDENADDSEPLQLVVDDEPLTMEARTSLAVQLIVLGDDGETVTITAPGLPPFATLTGTRLLLEPAFADAGDYAIELTATAGDRTDTEVLRLQVIRNNTGPMWQPVPILEGNNLSLSGYPEVASAVLRVPICDDEGDTITVHAEVVPSGTGFHHTPTHRATKVPDLHYRDDSVCAEIRLPLDGLAAGRYDIALHAVDDLGAEDPFGWVAFGGFVITP